MTITADSYYTNGKQNKGCQDYSLHESNFFPIPYIIICDGCSSSRHTDIGARLIAHAAKKVLHSLIEKDPDEEITSVDLEKNIVERMKDSIETLELPEESMDSTLLISFIKNGVINTFCFGDGQVFVKYKDGRSELTTISYKGNAPYYLSYQLNKDRMWEFISYSENNEEPLQTRFEERVNIKLDGSKEISKESTYYVKRAMPPVRIEDIEYYLLLSDGSESFVRRETGERIDSFEIVKEFSSFKNYKGEFIKRRIPKAIDSLSENGLYNTDDVSVAGFNFK